MSSTPDRVASLSGTGHDTARPYECSYCHAQDHRPLMRGMRWKCGNCGYLNSMPDLPVAVHGPASERSDPDEIQPGECHNCGHSAGVCRDEIYACVLTDADLVRGCSPEQPGEVKPGQNWMNAATGDAYPVASVRDGVIQKDDRLVTLGTGSYVVMLSESDLRKRYVCTDPPCEGPFLGPDRALGVDDIEVVP